MTYARLIGTGAYLPEKILRNAELEQTLDTTDAWIVERTGIRERRIAGDGETAATMGAIAASRALAMAGVSPDSVDMIITATCTPEKIFPASSCLIQNLLNMPHMPAFDVQAACSGFIYGLSIADQYIKSGQHKRILVIGTEVMSRLVDWSDRSTCILFGDGAGAVLLQADPKPGIHSTYLQANGQHHELLYAANLQAQAVINGAGSPYLYMQGNQVFRQAVNFLKQAALDTLAAHHLAPDSLDWLVPHQANIRIIQATADKLGLPLDKVILTLEKQGNTSSASIPLSLDYGIRNNKIKPGQTLLLEAFGGGLTWGTALISY